MRSLKPKVLLLADTSVNDQAVRELVNHLGVDKWESDARADSDLLTEIGGRLCYRSFAPGLNANVTKVREGNADYLANILKQKHGSVLEHGSVSFALLDVSRILTHELVRHRAGMAFSQESMRFVRLDNIGMYIPDLIPAFKELAKYHNTDGVGTWSHDLQRDFEASVRQVTELAERRIGYFSGLLDKEGVPFHVKKTITSALRRMAPAGHTTNILTTANHRAWRHTVENRTAPGAEVEIREVFMMIFNRLLHNYPAMYQDAKVTLDKEGIPFVSFDNSKV